MDFTEIGTLMTNKNGNGHFHRNYLKGEELPPIGYVYLNIDRDDPRYGKGMVIVDEDYGQSFSSKGGLAPKKHKTLSTLWGKIRAAPAALFAPSRHTMRGVPG